MPVKHLPLGLEAKHFDAWLDLWRRHCSAHLAPAEAAEMIGVAESIGERLQGILARHGNRPLDSY